MPIDSQDGALLIQRQIGIVDDVQGMREGLRRVQKFVKNPGLVAVVVVQERVAALHRASSHVIGLELLAAWHMAC
jgi:hypothetical protein